MGGAIVILRHYLAPPTVGFPNPESGYDVAMFTLNLQLAENPSTSLLAAIGELSTKALKGGAFMAWATSRGIDLITKDTRFSEFLKRGSFDLIVGTDSITNSTALEKIKELSESTPTLTTRLLVHNEPRLFHPKLLWFSYADGSIALLVGSGNLTDAGLRSNWEAFAKLTLESSEAYATVQELVAWRATYGHLLHLPHSSEAAIAVEQNKFSGELLRNITRQPKNPESKEPKEAETAADLDSRDDIWLCSELAKSRKNSAGESMFSQSSFPRSVFEKFFSFEPGGMDILLYHVDSTGSVGDLESRRGREKPASSNYYFELGSVQGEPYPKNGRPVALFRRLPTGEFLYEVLLPGHEGYDKVNLMLKMGAIPERKYALRRDYFRANDIRMAWPECPLLEAQLQNEY